MINFFAQIFILPKHIWQDIPEKVDVDDVLNFANESPVGSGPFQFDYWDRGKEMKVSAFKDHFHAPKCAGIVRIAYGSHDAMAAAIERGNVIAPGIFLSLPWFRISIRSTVSWAKVMQVTAGTDSCSITFVARSRIPFFAWPWIWSFHGMSFVRS